MISDVKKVLFFGTQKEIQGFFDCAQKEGLIEFISKKGSVREMPQDIADLHSAMSILKKISTDEIYEPDKESADTIAHQVILTQKKLEQLEKKEKWLKSEITKIAPFGLFSLDHIHHFESRSKWKIHFYNAKRGTADLKDTPGDLIHVYTDHDLDYFITVSPKEPDYPQLTRVHIHHSLQELKEQRKNCLDHIKECQTSLKKYAAYLEFLRKELMNKVNKDEYAYATQKIDQHLDGLLFSVCGWIPVKHEQRVEELIDEFAIEIYDVAIEDNEVIPTFMENDGLAEIGEDLVDIYDTPSPKDKDPSWWVLIAFAAFFGIIVSDAGYGMLYLAASTYGLVRLRNAGKSVKKLMQLAFILSVSSCIWGFAVCSYFGLDISPKSSLKQSSLIYYLTKKKAEYHIHVKDRVYHNWLKEYPRLTFAKSPDAFLTTPTEVVAGKLRYKMVDEFEDNILMELSLLIGIIHLTLSFLRNIRKSVSGLGWIAFMLGGYLYFPELLNATSLVHFLGILSKPVAFAVGLQLLYGGLIFAVGVAVLMQKLAGIGELMNALQVFADVLSYIRLYALGLAGMIMATTFNDLGRSAGLTLGIFITVCGHTVNMGLGIMSGVLHGLRLNFLEWYHYCFEGGGKKFNPLKLLRDE